MKSVRSLNRTDRVLCLLYAAIAAAALVGTQLELARHLTGEHDNVGRSLVTDALATPASTFAVIDLLAVATACVVFMVVEARRIGVRHVWVYLVLTFAVAVSVAFPLFLIARQFKVAAERGAMGDAQR